MAKTRKNRKKSIHTAKTHHNDPGSLAKKTILIVIALVFIVVITTTVVSFFLTSESRVKQQITDLASDYYENYFYTNLMNSPKYQSLSDQNAVMENYHHYGLSRKTLSDLLLYDNQKNYSYNDFLSKHCDINSTYVRIFPDPPYEKDSYHIEYHYACDF